SVMQAAINGLAQQAVLAGTPVEAGCVRIVRIDLTLAGHTQPHAGYRLAPCCRNGLATLFALAQALALGHAVARTFHRVCHGTVYLFLHGAVAGPTHCHVDHLSVLYRSNLEHRVIDNDTNQSAGQRPTTQAGGPT